MRCNGKVPLARLPRPREILLARETLSRSSDERAVARRLSFNDRTRSSLVHARKSAPSRLTRPVQPCFGALILSCSFKPQKRLFDRHLFRPWFRYAVIVNGNPCLVFPLEHLYNRYGEGVVDTLRRSMNKRVSLPLNPCQVGTYVWMS